MQADIHLKMFRHRPWAWRLAPWALVCTVATAGTAWGQNLSDLYALAREHDAEFLAARHSLDAARQRSPQAWGALLPQLSYSTSRQTQKGTLHFADEEPVAKDVESRNQGWQLTQGIVRPQQWAAVRQANAFEAQAEAEFVRAQQDLSMRLVQAYLDAWVASESVRVSAGQLEGVKAQQGLAKRNYEVGVTTITDVYEAQAKFDLTEAQSIGALNDLNARLAELEQILGRPVQQLHGIAEDAVLPGLTGEPLAAWVDLSHDAQPDVLLAKASVDVAKAGLLQQKAAFLPTVDLTLNNGTDRSTGSVTAPADVGYRTRTHQAALTLNWSLFDGGQSYFRTRESAYQLSKVQADLDAAQRRATTSVRLAYAGIRSGQAQIRALTSAVASSKKALDASKVGYRIGTRINIDVLNAENQYFAAQRDFAKARADTVMQWVRLQAASGSLTDDSIDQINAWLAPTGQPIKFEMTDFANESIKADEPRRVKP
ncbi:type I secretion protein TolC [Hydrogenophaga sp. PAMC20947]|nr:type I secretion protein TolC [Hydrogenophaga sp. PAMC20947]